MEIRRRSIGPISGSLILGFCAVAAAAHDDDRNDGFRQQAYSNHVLVSDGNVQADFTDPNLTLARQPATIPPKGGGLI